MRKKEAGSMAGIALAVLAAGVSAAAGEPCPTGTAPMARLELYFGAAGGRAAWTRFLRDVVTPRFPDGLTVIDGSGQWHGEAGLRRERTHILIVFYRRRSDGDARIEAIRTLYKRRFRQASVLRAETTACVGF